MACAFLCRFVPEAAIVNYYHLDSTLSGHTDHSEKDLSIPLLSIRLDNIPTFNSLLHTTSFCTKKKNMRNLYPLNCVLVYISSVVLGSLLSSWLVERLGK